MKAKTILILAMATAFNIEAAPINTTVITSEFINRLLAEARTNNPGFLAARFRAKAATANVGSIRIWNDPMFKFGESVFGSRGMSAFMWGDLSYGLEEKLPLWGIPRLNRQVASAESSVSWTEADFQLAQLRRDLAKALFTTALAERVVDIDAQNLAWLQTTVSAVDAKYRAGQTDAGDVLQIEDEVSSQTNQLQTDRLELSHDQFVLNRLLNRELDSPWPPLQLPPIAAPVPFSEKLLTLTMNNEPELKIADEKIQRAAAAAKLARRKRLPDVSAGVDGWQYSGDGQFRMGTFSLSFSLPWGNAGKYRKDYERAKDSEKAAEENRDDQMLTTHEMVHHMTIELDAARRKALLYQNEISIRAEQALADKLDGWESGHVTLREVLDAQRDSLDAQLMAARATVEQYQTLADLMLWTGQKNFESLTQLADEPDGHNN